MEIAGRLQADLCTRPVADDIIILRCSLASELDSRFWGTKLPFAAFKTTSALWKYSSRPGCIPSTYSELAPLGCRESCRPTEFGPQHLDI